MTKKISIPYFHKGLKYVTPLIFLAGLYLIFISYPTWGVILFLVGVVILTTNYVTEINLKDKIYKDYLALLGLHINADIKRFNSVDRIVITKGDYSQMMNTRSRVRQLDWVDYSGTLIFDEINYLNLLTKTDKEELLKGLKEFAEFLNVGVEDRTTRHYYWIDLTKV